MQFEPAPTGGKLANVRLALKTLLALMLFVAQANAFSLLGPYADWMQRSNWFRLPYDIGGPMQLGEEYRWNVPVLTYAFDQSFLDYFGSNGVVAVEQAVQILNDLPPASNMVLSNFPFDSRSYNYSAQVQGLYDLKSWTLSLLLEHMGLGEPTRNVFALRRWDSMFVSAAYEPWWPPGTIPYFIVERNFDPESLAPSHYVNDTLYTGVVWGYPTNADVVDYSVDPTTVTRSAVADRRPELGGCYTNLTRDDVGGLRYLLSSNNINYETLLPGVYGVGTNTGNYVNGAWRSGVEKITFVRQPYDPLLQQAVPFTNRFTDTYITNETVMHQQLERPVLQPDFLFSAADLGASPLPYSPWYARTSASNWVNHSVQNGEPTETGPGVIQPPVRITLHKLGPTLITSDPPGSSGLNNSCWGSFDASTNPPIAYPDATIQTNHEFLLRLRLDAYINGIWTSEQLVTWRAPIAIGQTATLQTSTSLTHWLSVATLTNRGTVTEWLHIRAQPQRFFRALLQ